jgi:hypothetical protein
MKRVRTDNQILESIEESIDSVRLWLIIQWIALLFLLMKV